MNIRKNIDYSDMYLAIDEAMAQDLSQMELYCAIGKAVSTRLEKGAAVAAAEYLTANYPNTRGFSPRNLRRMRDFYRAYENEPVLLALAMNLSWTSNIVILESDLTMEEGEWYLNATQQFGWSKQELIEKINSQAYLKMALVCVADIYNNKEKKAKSCHFQQSKALQIIRKIRFKKLWCRCSKGVKGLRPIMYFKASMGKRILFMRC